MPKVNKVTTILDVDVVEVVAVNVTDDPEFSVIEFALVDNEMEGTVSSS